MKLTQELINVLQGIHDGKPWQYRYHAGLPWQDSHDDARPISTIDMGYEIRLKPEPVRVPLGPEDVPIGSVIKHYDWTEEGWLAVLSRSEKFAVCWVSDITVCFSFIDFTRDGYVINRSLPLTGKWDPNAWEPCWKEVQP